MFFLENEIIGLRCLCLEDLNGGYRNWFNDAEVCYGNGHHRYPMTLSELEHFVEEANTTKSEIILAVVEKGGNVHIGNIALQRIDLINRHAEVSLIFGERDYWNKGYASMAVRLLIDHAFKELGLNTLAFGTLENNVGMIKLGEKLGFKKAGVFRKAFFKNGQYMDLIYYDLLSSEWDVIK